MKEGTGSRTVAVVGGWGSRNRQPCVAIYKRRQPKEEDLQVSSSSGSEES